MGGTDDAGGDRPFDLLLHGGTVVDPGRGWNGPLDVAVRDGRVAMLGVGLDPNAAASSIDVTGLVVTPGLVDIHGHFFEGITIIPCRADDVCLPAGVTTAADAGTAGWATLETLTRYVAPSQLTKVRIWLNIVASGYLMKRVLDTEFHDPRVIDVDQTVAAIEANRDWVLGVKVRIDVGLQTEVAGRRAFAQAIEAAARAGLPLMVHAVHPSVPLAEILEGLRPGDVVTHAYNGSLDGPLDPSGLVRDCVREAYDRGVLFDVGYAGGYLCDLDVVRRAIEQGAGPHTLGTDIVAKPVATDSFYSVDGLLGLFHALGMSWDDALRAATSAPAAALGLADGTGGLSEGAPADIAVFRFVDEPCTWHGANGQHADDTERLECVQTIINGESVWTR